MQISKEKLFQNIWPLFKMTLLMLGASFFLGLADSYMLKLLRFEYPAAIIFIEAVIALVFGTYAGWIWGGRGLFLLLSTVIIFEFLGAMELPYFYSSDIGPGLPVIGLLFINLPFLALGVATGRLWHK